MKKVRNPTRAQRELKAAEQSMLDRWAHQPKFGRPVRLKPLPPVPKLSAPVGRETTRYPSLSTPGGAGTKPCETLRYTGTEMLGIGTLHKSNAVPVFNTGEAIEMARMRRG